MSEPAPATRVLDLLSRLRHEVFSRDLADAPRAQRALILPIRVAILSATGVFRHQVLVFAAAAVAVSRRWGQLGERVTVELPGGELEVNWSGPGSPLWQTGPTAAVYEGYIEL